MPEQPKVNVARVVGPGPIAALDGFNALNQIVHGASDCIKIHHVERTEQGKIRAYAETEVSRIKAAEAILKGYFEQVFAERRATFDELFRASTKRSTKATARCIAVVVSRSRGRSSAPPLSRTSET